MLASSRNSMSTPQKGVLLTTACFSCTKVIFLSLCPQGALNFGLLRKSQEDTRIQPQLFPKVTTSLPFSMAQCFHSSCCLHSFIQGSLECFNDSSPWHTFTTAVGLLLVKWDYLLFPHLTRFLWKLTMKLEEIWSEMIGQFLITWVLAFCLQQIKLSLA